MAESELVSVLTPSGNLASGQHVPDELGRADLLKLYELMLRQRLLDELMLTLQRQGRIGFYGAATGQEAAVFGTGWALEERDWILPALREGGIALMRGYPLEDYLAQCFGNLLDKSLGRQMPCHYGARAQHYVTLSSPIANQLPHAVGVAWAMKLRGTGAVCAGYLGDGATSENDFHTALGMAGRARLPVVFVCQNNQWAISIPVSGQTRAATLAVKATAYGMPGVRVDGNDVLGCFVVMRDAVARARRGEGPSFIEALTYRMGAHSTSDDPSRYRDESVTQGWKERDPILRFKRFLTGQGILEDARLEVRLGEEIRAALARVEAAPALPPLGSLFDDVYAARPWFLEEESRLAERHAAEAGQAP
jgi:pyruvate dehydrogenase E1 component alpha subunit/2-oxoisovalerate dehydrogenase E1 component alpha subunit